jgi:hypothetical protein
MNTNGPRPNPDDSELESNGVTNTAVPKPRTIEEFDAWFDAELEKLEARWIDLASPNARRMKFGRNFK